MCEIIATETMAAQLVIRPTVKEDCKALIKMIVELAEFEGMADQVQITEDMLVRDGFETTPPFYKCLLVELDGEPIGYALYFYSYDIYAGGRSLYLEDLYIKEEFRGKGYGIKLFRFITQTAKEQECVGMQWCVLNWNKKAIDFYNGLGAYDYTLKDKRHMYRLDDTAMTNLLK